MYELNLEMLLRLFEGEMSVSDYKDFITWLFQQSSDSDIEDFIQPSRLPSSGWYTVKRDSELLNQKKFLKSYLNGNLRRALNSHPTREYIVKELFVDLPPNAVTVSINFEYCKLLRGWGIDVLEKLFSYESIKNFWGTNFHHYNDNDNDDEYKCKVRYEFSELWRDIPIDCARWLLDKGLYPEVYIYIINAIYSYRYSEGYKLRRDMVLLFLSYGIDPTIMFIPTAALLNIDDFEFLLSLGVDLNIIPGLDRGYSRTHCQIICLSVLDRNNTGNFNERYLDLMLHYGADPKINAAKYTSFRFHLERIITEWENGRGHFSDTSGRIMNKLLWLLDE